MHNKDVETKLKTVVEHLTPDVLDDILAKCGESEGRQAQRGSVFVMQSARRARRWVRVAGSLAAVFVLIFGGLLVFNTVSNNRVDALVMLDVNPSIELKVNRSDRVIDVAAQNEDAVIILDNMELRDTTIDVAINALIGSMLKYGYIQENANSVLLSVESVNGEKSAALQRNLTQSISQQLNMVNGAVISQNLTSDEELQRLADEQQISYGKAALIQKILSTNSHMLFDDLAKLSVNELNLLVDSKRIEAEGMEAQGRASDKAYIGEEQAKQAALAHIGIGESEAELLRVELDYEDGFMVYDVEFYYNNIEYEYEINAGDGTVIGYDRDNNNGNNSNRRNPENGQENNAPAAQTTSDFIGEDRALKIAETHAGVTAHTRLKVKLDKDDGLYIYEVEFEAGRTEYDYEINAVTGEILSWDAEN